MKKIDTSAISGSAKAPFIKPTHDHYKQSIQETTASIVNGLVNYTTNDVIILYGCVFTGTDPGARTMTAGAIYHNGEIYLVPAASFTTTGSNIPLWTIATSYAGTDPVFWSDGVSRNLHQIDQFVLVSGPVGGSGITGYVCDYNSAVVKNLSDNLNSGAWKSASVAVANGSDSTSLGSKTVFYVKNGKTVTVTFNMSIVPAGGTTTTIYIALPSGINPSIQCYNIVDLQDLTLSTVSLQPYIYTAASVNYLTLYNGNTGHFTNGSTYNLIGQITFGCQ